MNRALLGEVSLKISKIQLIRSGFVDTLNARFICRENFSNESFYETIDASTPETKLRNKSFNANGNRTSISHLDYFITNLNYLIH
ncbi:hypothetical protein PUN28_016625 [Cardiocondyla obscurior]|uniref:THAP-type domain-containing protein n=1 Tax=Cardiocondyla obscurior TaxID=286306 RepID=A0AAW2EQA0_9HYME